MALSSETPTNQSIRDARFITGELLRTNMFTDNGSILVEPRVPDGRELQILSTGIDTMAANAIGDQEQISSARAGVGNAAMQGHKDAVAIIGAYVDTQDYVGDLQVEIERQVSISGAYGIGALASAVFLRYLFKGTDVSALETDALPILLACLGAPHGLRSRQLMREKSAMRRELATIERIARKVSGVVLPESIPVVTPRTITRPISGLLNIPHHVRLESSE